MSILSYLSKKYVIVAVGGALILVLALVGFYFKTVGRFGAYLPAREDKSSSQEQNPAKNIPSGEIKVEGTGKYTIEMLPVGSSDNVPQYPVLDRPLSFPQSYSEEARKIMTDKINATIAALKKDPNQYGEWANLGIFRNGINDWEGARQIWEFLTVMSPSQPAPFANLANLYAFSLKDPVRAEANLKKAIEKGPLEMSVYRLGYEFYRFVRKDDALAKETLANGIAKTSSSDLQYLLDHYDEL